MSAWAILSLKTSRMRGFKQTFFLLLFFMVPLGAINLNYFNATYERALLKDQTLYINVYDRGSKRLIRFRWTLFHNQGLVTISHLFGEPRQHILYARYKQNSIKFPLALKDEEKSLYHPYLLITFLGYDYTTKRAKFEIRHKDASNQTRIELKNRILE